MVSENGLPLQLPQHGMQGTVVIPTASASWRFEAPGPFAKSWSLSVQTRSSDVPSAPFLRRCLMMKKRNLLLLLPAVALAACSDPEKGAGVLPENMAEENLPAVDTVQENQFDVDVKTIDVGNDAVAVR